MSFRISTTKGAEKTNTGITVAAYGGAFTGDIDILINTTTGKFTDKGDVVIALRNIADNLLEREYPPA